MVTERRKSVRVSCNLPSSFKDSGEDNSWSSCFVSVKDMSHGGMRLRTHKPISLSSRLDIAFMLPNPYHKTVTEAKVAPCWVTQASDGNYDIGVRFVDMSDDTRIAIRNSC